MRSRILVGALVIALGVLLGGLEGLALASLIAALLAIPNRRKSKKYAVRFVA